MSGEKLIAKYERSVHCCSAAVIAGHSIVTQTGRARIAIGRAVLVGARMREEALFQNPR